MAGQELKEFLNKAIARELKVAIQYMWQHVLIKGKRAKFISAELRAAAIGEMMHAEKIAERLVYLGGKPTTQPDPVDIDGNENEMLLKDVKEEEHAIEMYKKIIALASQEGDSTTRLLFEQILAEEEAHHSAFLTLLGE